MFHVAIVYFYHLLVFCWMLYHSLFIHFTANDCFQFVSVVDIIEHFYWCAYAQAEIGLAGHLFQLKKKKRKVLLEHSHTQSFTYLWLFLCYKGRFEQLLQRLCGLKAQNVYSVWPSQKKIANPAVGQGLYTRSLIAGSWDVCIFNFTG